MHFDAYPMNFALRASSIRHKNLSVHILDYLSYFSHKNQCWVLRGKIHFYLDWGMGKGGKNRKIVKMADFCHFYPPGLKSSGDFWIGSYFCVSYYDIESQVSWSPITIKFYLQMLHVNLLLSEWVEFSQTFIFMRVTMILEYSASYCHLARWIIQVYSKYFFPSDWGGGMGECLQLGIANSPCSPPPPWCHHWQE